MEVTDLSGGSVGHPQPPTTLDGVFGLAPVDETTAPSYIEKLYL